MWLDNHWPKMAGYSTSLWLNSLPNDRDESDDDPTWTLPACEQVDEHKERQHEGELPIIPLRVP
jgi:hypothetical protein